MNKTEKTSQYPDNDQRAAVQTLVSGGVESDVRYYIFGSYIDEVLMMHDGTGDLYYAHDHLYSPVALFAPNGTVAERCEYDVYGKVHILAPNYELRTASLYGNPYTFTGRELDTLDNNTLHLYYYRARTYDPETGRFMQRDPLGMNPFSNNFDFNPLLNVHVLANLYSYVGNNPIFYVDPLGLVEVEFGTYIGLGKSVKVSPKIEKKDCCQNNVRIVNGIKIAKVGVYAHAGFGLGVKIKGQGIGIDLSWIGPGLIASGEVIIEKNDCLDGLWKGGGCIRGGADGGTSLSFSVLKWSGHMDIDGEFTAGICIFGDTNGKITLSEEFCYNIGLNAEINFWPFKPKTFDGREEGCEVFSQSISF